MTKERRIRSVAVIGAGASGAVAAAALAAERYFERIRVFDRRETPGGTWNYDIVPHKLEVRPGCLPPETDPPLKLPANLPAETSPCTQERFVQTPVYPSVTTNVPQIAMSFSDRPFAYGPFVPHYVTRQYIENYFSVHKTDSFLVLNTTVEDVSRIQNERWKLTLRKHDAVRQVDFWWEEEFDALILGNGHYAVPYVPEVKGLEAYMKTFPNRIIHSKVYRDPSIYSGKSVIIIGNSASGLDLAHELPNYVKLPLYQSRRTPSRFEGDEPPQGVVWKPIIKEYLPSGRIIFADDTYLDHIDTVIYCTGYRHSFPFWNTANNGHALWNYAETRLDSCYLHTFIHHFPTLGIIGVPRVLAFRSFEYQAVALARLFSNRNGKPLPATAVQLLWERERWELVKSQNRRFHDIEWEKGETLGWFRELFEIAGLPTLTGEGRVPPVFGDEVKWAIENIRKHPTRHHQEMEEVGDGEGEKWLLVCREDRGKGLLGFI